MLVFVQFSTLLSVCLLDHRQKPPWSRQWFSCFIIHENYIILKSSPTASLSC